MAKQKKEHTSAPQKQPDNRSPKHRKKQGASRALLLTALLALLAGGIAYGYYEYNSRVYRHCVTEAGSVIAPEDFGKDPSKPVTYAEGFDPAAIRLDVPGDYTVDLKSGIFTYHSTLTVEDTVPPQAEGRTLRLVYGESAAAEDFVEAYSDATQVAFSFAEEPDFDAAGIREVGVILTDLGGNQTLVQSELIVSPFVASLTVEAGSAFPEARDFLLEEFRGTGGSGGEDAALVTDPGSVPMDQPGSYSVICNAGGVDFEAELVVADTVPPVLELQDLSGYIGKKFALEDFVVLAEDETEITLSYEQEPDWELAGEQTVTIRAADLGGNETSADAVLSMQYDTEPPVIEGARNITIWLGDSVSYRSGVAAVDNSDGEVALQIDTSGVNLAAEGTYPVVYSATDSSGNTAEKTVTLTVRVLYYDEGTVNAMAQSVLAGLITPEMNDYDKLVAIFYWVRRNIHYVNHTDKDNLYKAAAEGLAKGQGDCYCYMATSKVLLDNAGITNMIIEKIPAATRHYWNLVDIGEGWRHFDTTPRIGGGDFLYWDDATLMAYSASHNNSHNYDHSVYTDIP